MVLVHSFSFSLLRSTILLIVSFCFVEPASVKTFIYSPKNEYYLRTQAEGLQNYFDNYYNGEKIGVFNQLDLGYRFLFYYIAYDNNPNVSYFQVNGQNTTQDLIDLIGSTQLLYVGDYDEKLLYLWDDCVNVELYNHTLYRVLSIDDNNVVLEQVYSWDY